MNFDLHASCTAFSQLCYLVLLCLMITFDVYHCVLEISTYQVHTRCGHTLFGS